MSDQTLRAFVLQELEWEPGVKATDIGVAVDHGVVGLSGFVDTYRQKFDAEEAVKRVHGVRGVANDLEVRVGPADHRPDPDIARAAVHALESLAGVPVEQLQVTVRDGVLILEGEVDWKCQSVVAESAVRGILGVRDLRNRIRVKPRLSAGDVRRQIEEALQRSARLEARRITVETKGSTVLLRGRVDSWHEREEAVAAAWKAPGVLGVEDHLWVEPEEMMEEPAPLSGAW